MGNMKSVGGNILSGLWHKLSQQHVVFMYRGMQTHTLLMNFLRLVFSFILEVYNYLI